MKAALEVGQTVRIELDEEWYGATVVEVQSEDSKSHWYSVKLEESTSMAPKGVIVGGLHDTDYVDYDGETIPADIKPSSVLVMRADKGELGTDTCSVGSGETIQKAVEDTLEHFKTDCAEFKETPEAMKSVLDQGFWSSEDRKVQYYLKF
jgi:hypothetical protein